MSTDPVEPDHDERRSVLALADSEAGAVATLVLRVATTVLAGAITVETGLSEGWLDGYPLIAAAFTALAGWSAITTGRALRARLADPRPDGAS